MVFRVVLAFVTVVLCLATSELTSCAGRSAGTYCVGPVMAPSLPFNHTILQCPSGKLETCAPHSYCGKGTGSSNPPGKERCGPLEQSAANEPTSCAGRSAGTYCVGPVRAPSSPFKHTILQCPSGKLETCAPHSYCGKGTGSRNPPGKERCGPLEQSAANLSSAKNWPCPNPNVGKFMVNYDKNKCIDIALNGATGPFNGARLQVWDCNGGANQQFIWCSDGRIVSAMNKGFCLDIPGGNPYIEADTMQMWECNGQPGQKWSYGANRMEIYSTNTGGSSKPKGMCLDTAGGSTNDGTSIVNYYANNGCTPWYAASHLRSSNATVMV